MPLYDYLCENCGPFATFAGMADCDLPQPCPACNGSGRRLLTAPNLAVLSSSQRSAHERNERSAHEPRLHQKHTCGAHCSHHAKPKRETPKLKAGRADARPWMIGH